MYIFAGCHPAFFDFYLPRALGRMERVEGGGGEEGGGGPPPQSTQKAQVPRVVLLQQNQLRLRHLWGKTKSVCKSAPGEGGK